MGYYSKMLKLSAYPITKEKIYLWRNFCSPIQTEWNIFSTIIKLFIHKLAYYLE